MLTFYAGFNQQNTLKYYPFKQLLLIKVWVHIQLNDTMLSHHYVDNYVPRGIL